MCDVRANGIPAESRGWSTMTTAAMKVCPAPAGQGRQDPGRIITAPRIVGDA